MKRRVCQVGLGVGFGLTIVIAYLLFGAGSLVSSPDTVRQTYYDTPPFDDWDYTFSPTKGKSWSGRMIKEADLIFEERPDSVRVTALAELFVKNYAYATLMDPWKPRQPVLIHASKETQSVTLPDGETLAIDEVFTAYPTGPGAADWVSGFFDPLTLEPFEPKPGKESPIIKPDRGGCHFWPQQEFPEMAFAVKGDLTYELNSRLFDMGTRQPLNERRMAGNLFTVPLRQWHSSAFRCVIDLVSGPIEEREMVFEKGASVSFTDFDLEMILVETLNHPVIDQGWLGINMQNKIIPVFSGSPPPAPSAPPGPPQRRYTWTLDPAEIAAGSLVAFSLSNIQWLPPSFELEVSNQSGALTKVTASCIGNLVFIVLPGHPEEWQSLSVRFPSTWVRAIFEFDRIPGLPRANYGLSNLFDVHVPYSKSNYRPSRFLSHCTKLKLGGLRSTRAGPASFEYKNTTVREIAKDFRANAGIFGLKVVDGQRLEGARSPLVWLKDSWQEFRSRF